VPDSDPIRSDPIRSDPVRSFSDEADQHRNDSNDEDACRFKGFGGEGTAALQDVEDGRGLGRRASGHSVEALLFRRAKLARAFGNVEDDGGASSVELILEMSAARRHEVVDLIEQIEQLEGALVDVELGVIEGHGLDIVRGRAKLRVRIDNRDQA